MQKLIKKNLRKQKNILKIFNQFNEGRLILFLFNINYKNNNINIFLNIYFIFFDYLINF